MMKRPFLCLYVFSNLLFAISWEPTTDYCKIKCPFLRGAPVHTACNCKLEAIPPREEILDDLQEFRRNMLNIHNELRNRIASGEEQKKNYPPAANMLALSYNLEVEYIARCAAVKFEGYHDKCRKLSNAEAMLGQNLAGSNKKKFVLGKEAAELMIPMYNELDNVIGDRKQFIKAFNSSRFKGANQIGHFSTMVWWSNKFIGCARVHHPKPPVPNFEYTIICNFGGPIDAKDTPSADGGYSVYKEGKPCSACPNGTSCSTQYKALCGTIDPIPGDENSQSGGNTSSMKWHVFALIVQILLNFSIHFMSTN